MPFAATVYSLLLVSSPVTTPAIEELTAIWQRELSEEEIAAQIESSRVERIESQYDGRELPGELEEAAEAETQAAPAPAPSADAPAVYPTEVKAAPEPAHPAAGAVRETVVTPTPATPALLENLPSEPAPAADTPAVEPAAVQAAPEPAQPAAGVIRETVVAPAPAVPAAPESLPARPAAGQKAAAPRIEEKEVRAETIDTDPGVVLVTGTALPEAVPSAQTPTQAQSPAPVQGYTVTPAKKADYTLIAPPVLTADLMPAGFGKALEGDDVIVAALEAVRKNNDDALRAMAARVRNHPLGGYVALWAINARAAQDLKKTKKLSRTVERDYERFIAAHRTEYLAERARTDWIRNAAKAGDAGRFAALYPHLEWNKNERDIVCMRQSFALGKGKPSAAALAQAKKLLLNTTAPQIDACRDLADKTLKADRSWTWQYLLILLQKKRYMMAAELVRETPAKYLPVGKRELGQILANPSRWLQRNSRSLSKKSTRLLIAASLRIVQKDLGAAARIAQAADGRLNASSRALLWGRLAYEAAVDQDAAALRYYKRAGKALKSAPSSTLIVNGTSILVWQARAALRSGTPGEVLEAVSMLPASVRAGENWKYWRARMLEATGDRAGAEKLMTGLARGYEFYNLLAADWLGKPYYKGPESVTPPAQPARWAVFAKNPSVVRAVRFYALGLPNEGHREWNWALRSMKARDRLEIAEYAGALGLAHRRINTAASTGRAAAFNQLYPKPFETEIVRAADQAGLPRDWVFGLIRQESRFISLALSTAGARGLMQVMPATARWVARQTGLDCYKNNQISDIETNLFLGTQYLKLVRENVSPNVTVATASYNGGPSKAAAWRSTLTREVEGALFAETIPYSETRDYVMRVTANTVQYSRYTEEPLRITDLLGRIAPEALSGNIIP